VALDDALKEHEEDYPENAQVMELHFFGGYTKEETPIHRVRTITLIAHIR